MPLDLQSSGTLQTWSAEKDDILHSSQGLQVRADRDPEPETCPRKGACFSLVPHWRNRVKT